MQAGGILRTSADTTWETPEFVLERVRVAFGGPIPFDPFTTLANPTKADRICAGPEGTLYGEASSLVIEGHQTACACDGCALARRNGLHVRWEWPFWTNPPFTRECITKIGVEVGAGARGYALLPCNRDEEPFMQHVLSLASWICYVNAESFQKHVKGNRKRIAFISTRDRVPVAKNPFASRILGFEVSGVSFFEAFSPLGGCFVHRPMGRARWHVTDGVNEITSRGPSPFADGYAILEETNRKLEEASIQVRDGVHQPRWWNRMGPPRGLAPLPAHEFNAESQPAPEPEYRSTAPRPSENPGTEARGDSTAPTPAQAHRSPAGSPCFHPWCGLDGKYCSPECAVARG